MPFYEGSEQPAYGQYEDYENDAVCVAVAYVVTEGETGEFV